MIRVLSVLVGYFVPSHLLLRRKRKYGPGRYRNQWQEVESGDTLALSVREGTLSTGGGGVSGAV